MVSIAEGKAAFVVILLGILGAFTGIFELVAIDMAEGAPSRFGLAAALFLCAPILILAGTTADIVCNWQLCEP